MQSSRLSGRKHITYTGSREVVVDLTDLTLDEITGGDIDEWDELDDGAQTWVIETLANEEDA